MSDKKAVVTVAIGKKFQEELGSVTHPTFKAYAEKIGADFIVIDHNPFEKDGITPHFAKLGLRSLYKDYARIIFIDTDCIIRPDCPNLFDIVPPTKFGAFAEGQFIPRRMMDLEMAANTYSVKIRMNPKEWKGQYFNTGVLVTSRIHKMIFNPPDFGKILNRVKLQERVAVIQQKMQTKTPLTGDDDKFIREINSSPELQKVISTENWDYGEQGWINLQLINSATPVHYMTYNYNRMTVMDEKTGEDRHASYIIHYAGAPNEIPTPEGNFKLPEFIRRDLGIWEKNAPDYKFKRHVLVTVGGGMGDQIDAEPVVRYIKETVYPGEDIRVISDWPRIFQHLDLPCDKRPDIKLEPESTYYQMETLPIPESEFGSRVAHAMMHSTDYSALSCIRTTLPHDKKQIRLQTTLDDVARLLDAVGTLKIRDMVLVHPGRGWPSKTFPSTWWQSVIDGIKEKGLTVCLIGKHIGKDQGLVDVDCREGMIDLRNKCDVGMLFTLISQARVMISNDSAPVHIAGAFDNYLIAIPTCKHPDHILPWRNGSQYYKTAAMYKELTCSRIDNAPTMVHGQTIDWIAGGDITPYLPEPKDIAEQAKLFYDKSVNEDDNASPNSNA